MILAIITSLLFIVIAIIIRYTIVQKPLEKAKASWLCFGLAIGATMVCTLISGGEQQSTLITGFATMLLSYNILNR